MATNTFRRFVFVMCMGGVFLALAMTAGWTWVTTQRAKAEQGPDLPILSSIAPFSLTDTDEQTFSLGNLADRVWVVSFFSTDCEDPCAVVTDKMAQLVRRMKGRVGLDFLSISVAPDTDTPSVLREYAHAVGADTRVWHFLTGAKETIQELAQESFKLGNPGEPLVHSARLILVDRNHRIRGYYDGTDSNQLRLLARDIFQLLDNPS